jgi:hypothetical protein
MISDAMAKGSDNAVPAASSPQPFKKSLLIISIGLYSFV